MPISIVCGLGFGDEGKGLITSHLATINSSDSSISAISADTSEKSGSSEKSGLVIRFNGGQQAGHTVVKDTVRHVFSNFGSATFEKYDTFWSQFCTVCPTGIRNEYQELLEKFKEINPNEKFPKLIIHGLCPVTTPFDRYFNIKINEINQHGSCGVGFGATLERHEKYYKLYFQDLFYPKILRTKLNNIKEYYKSKNLLNPNWIHAEFLFKNDIEFLIDEKIIFDSHHPYNFQIFKTNDSYKSYQDIIFEGAQGTLLDMDFGFFPNVTRSNTTIKNAIELINNKTTENIDIYYVTRAYQTRHGNGYMSDNDINIINNADETNKTNPYQGEFRTGSFDFDLIKYSLRCNENFTLTENTRIKNHIRKNIVITCCDQVLMPLKIILNGNIKYVNLKEFNELLKTELNFHPRNIFYNSSPSGNLGYYPNELRNPLTLLGTFP